MRFSFLPPRRGLNIPKYTTWIAYLQTSPRMQQAFMVCAFSVLLCAFLGVWESLEIRLAQLHYERARIDLETLEHRMARLRAATAIVEQLGQKARAVALVRERTVAHVQAIEAVGDSISRRSWLVALHEEAGTVHLRGRARSAADVGETLADLQSLHVLHDARLDALRALTGGPADIVEFDILLSESTP